MYNYRDRDRPKMLFDNSPVLLSDFDINLQQMLDEAKIGFGNKTIEILKKFSFNDNSYTI